MNDNMISSASQIVGDISGTGDMYQVSGAHNVVGQNFIVYVESSQKSEDELQIEFAKATGIKCQRVLREIMQQWREKLPYPTGGTKHKIWKWEISLDPKTGTIKTRFNLQAFVLFGLIPYLLASLLWFGGIGGALLYFGQPWSTVELSVLILGLSGIWFWCTKAFFEKWRDSTRIKHRFIEYAKRASEEIKGRTKRHIKRECLN